MIMHILQIANGYLTQHLYADLFDELEKQGINNTVYVPININTELTVKKSVDKRLIISQCFSNIDRLFFYTKQKKIFADVATKVSMNSIDLIHGHTLFSGGYLAYRMNKAYNIPYIVAVRNTDLNIFMKYMLHLRHVGRTIVKNAEQVIFLSPVYRDRFMEYISPNEREVLYKKTEIIPNGINKFWIDNKYMMPRAVNIRCMKLIFIGSICANKGIDVLIAACRKLIQNGYTLKLLIVGKVEDHKYSAIIRSCQFIDYVGYRPKEDILQYMRASDLLIVPSKTETFGLVYAEAMSQGLPVIYTKGEGFDKQFEEGVVGYHILSNDVQSICDAILSIYRNYHDISRRCTQLINKFNWEGIAKEYYKTYKKCISIKEFKEPA